MGKGEIARYEQFLLFPQVFSKDLYCRHIKTRACLGKCVNSLPNDRILDRSKLKPFGGDNIKVFRKMIFVFDRVENIVGKGKKCCFLLFPQCFRKNSYSGSLKVEIVLKRVKEIGGPVWLSDKDSYPRAALDPPKFFRGRVLWQDTSEPQPRYFSACLYSDCRGILNYFPNVYLYTSLLLLFMY